MNTPPMTHDELTTVSLGGGKTKPRKKSTVRAARRDAAKATKRAALEAEFGIKIIPNRPVQLTRKAGRR